MEKTKQSLPFHLKFPSNILIKCHKYMTIYKYIPTKSELKFNFEILQYLFNYYLHFKIKIEAIQFVKIAIYLAPNEFLLFLNSSVTIRDLCEVCFLVYCHNYFLQYKDCFLYEFQKKRTKSKIHRFKIQSINQFFRRRKMSTS